MPKMEMSLEELIKKQKEPLPKTAIIKYLYTLVAGLEYLQNRRIAHRDLKPGNILVDKNGDLKIADIGIGKFVAEDESQVTFHDGLGTKMYMSPERLASKIQMKRRDMWKADIWSLGMVIADLCLLKPERIYSYTKDEEKLNIVKRIINMTRERYDNELADLIENMLSFNAEQRKSFTEIRKILETRHPAILVLKSCVQFE